MTRALNIIECVIIIGCFIINPFAALIGTGTAAFIETIVIELFKIFK